MMQLSLKAKADKLCLFFLEPVNICNWYSLRYLPIRDFQELISEKSSFMTSCAVYENLQACMARPQVFHHVCGSCNTWSYTCGDYRSKYSELKIIEQYIWWIILYYYSWRVFSFIKALDLHVANSILLKETNVNFFCKYLVNSSKKWA